MTRATPFWGLLATVILLALRAPLGRAQTESEVLPPPTPVPGGWQQEQSLPPGPPDADPTHAPHPGYEGEASNPLGLSPLFSPTVGHALYRVDFRSTWFPEEPVPGQPTKLGYVEEDLSVSVPLWQDCANEWLGSLHVRGEFYQTHAILPGNDQPFPPELWNIRFGTSYRHLFDNGWVAGGSLSVGSASDVPFQSINVMTAGISTFLRIPQGEHNAWLFTLSYSPTSELGVPIPGVAFVYQPSDQLRINLGLPFQVLYRPCEDLTLDFSYMLLRTVHARATYRLCRPVRVYVGYDWENESYFLADRVDLNDRFFYYDQRLTAGV